MVQALGLDSLSHLCEADVVGDVSSLVSVIITSCFIILIVNHVSLVICTLYLNSRIEIKLS